MKDKDTLLLESLYNKILLKEADVIDISNKVPLKDNQTIRVYHGIDNERDLTSFLKYGTTGKIKAPRRYSYEANNNPYGFFVTVDLKTAKEFGNKYIMEFHSRVSDLEAPMWPSGNYTVQGQAAQYWNSPEEREEFRIKTREGLRKNTYDFIIQSDRPELADSIYLNYEHQALFIGDLNSNSIRAIWVNKTPKMSGKYSSYDRYETKEFIKRFDDIISKEGYDTDFNKEGVYKLLKPRDEVTEDSIINAFLNYKKRFNIKSNESDAEIVKGYLKYIHKDDMKQLVWNHQIDDAWNVIEALKKRLFK